MRRTVAVALAVVVTLGTVPGAALAGAAPAATNETAESQSEAYAGAHVSFEASGDAVADYAVGGDVVLENVAVAPQDEAEAGGGLGVDVGLSAVTNLAGVGVSLDAQTQTRAEVATEGSASLTAHDTERGILTVDAGEEEQYVEVDLAGDADAEADGDGRVVVDSGERQGAFVVVGDGDVTVNDDGGVTADLGSDATLVFRSYEDGERDEDDREQESLIAEGTATAEVYAEERDGERVTDAATYAEDLSVEARSDAEGSLEMTVDRARSEGTVVLASVSDAAMAGVESAEDVDVTVDGEAAVEASSYSELEGGIGEEPRYTVRQSGDASASADVLVAVDHFSEREVAVQSSDDGAAGSGAADDGSDGSDGTDDGGAADGNDGSPGFGVAAALAALLSAVAARLRA